MLFTAPKIETVRRTVFCTGVAEVVVGLSETAVVVI